ncbi:Aste57867_3571 [Aphanomyces stellatus]|uniref:Aste57867_3571 protein n=1 Tax=Aphanomyces stellatus TaxID=120398 RepID=A0A485KCE1_9STRA|nr:hypothetical protein As57867_003560 [Aphanomyces stellatus]VFT80733.1 Aste57867_3571 [Aphanomyces stellatus]
MSWLLRILLVFHSVAFAAVLVRISYSTPEIQLTLGDVVEDFNDTILYVDFTAGDANRLMLLLYPQPRLQGTPMEVSQHPFWVDFHKGHVRSIQVVLFNTTTMATIAIFAGTFSQGTQTLYRVGDVVNNFEANGTAMAMVLHDDVVLVEYPKPFLQGTPSFVVQNPRSPLLSNTQSFQVMTRDALADAIRATNHKNVILWTQNYMWRENIIGSNLSYELLSKGHVIQNATYPMFVTTLDIPTSLKVQAFREPNFTGAPIVWTTTQTNPFLGSLRVWAQDDVLPPYQDEPVVTFYPLLNGHRCERTSLSVSAGQNVTSVLYLKALFFKGFEVMEVPKGLVVWGFPEMSLGGTPTKYDTKFYWHNTMSSDALSTMENMQSFQVMVEGSTPNTPDPLSPIPAVVTCKQNTNITTLFHVGGYYPMVQPGICLSFDVPIGVSLILYDETWLLGTPYYWNATHDTKLLNEWTSRVRSLQVLDAHASSGQLAPNVTFDLANNTVEFPYETGSYHVGVGAVVPAIGEWEMPKSSVAPRRGILLVAYPGYNFQGRPRIYSAYPYYPYSPYNSPPFKSYMVIRQAATPANISNTPIPTPPLFVGCYTPDFGFDVTPIFMQPNAPFLLDSSSLSSANPTLKANAQPRPHPTSLCKPFGQLMCGLSKCGLWQHGPAVHLLPQQRYRRPSQLD